MSVRTFLFCDRCNPQALRAVEQRRASGRDLRGGRRISDGRAWFDGSEDEAVGLHGWKHLGPGRHLCPSCATRAGASNRLSGDSRRLEPAAPPASP